MLGHCQLKHLNQRSSLHMPSLMMPPTEFCAAWKGVFQGRPTTQLTSGPRHRCRFGIEHVSHWARQRRAGAAALVACPAGKIGLEAD